MKRLTPEEKAAYDQYSDTEKINFFRNIRLRLISSTEGPGNAEMASELDALKKQIEQLTTAQKDIADSVSKKIMQDRAVADALVQVGFVLKI